MHIKIGDMFSQTCDVLIVTANATVRNDGHLVMGRGAALAAKSIYHCDREFGQLVNLAKSDEEYEREVGYRILIHRTMKNPELAIFQVKHHFKDRADIYLIQNAVNLLAYYAQTRWLGKTISLNYPGIGNGQLKSKDVLPYLEKLPDNVTVWRLS